MIESALEIGDGLVLRCATAHDVPPLVDLHAEAYADDPHGSGLEADEYQLRDLLQKSHPTFNGREMTVVEDTRTGRIVSSQHLSHHQWTYDGTPFPVGEIEHVSTREAFRQRGLVRRQTDIMHGWSKDSGEVATAVNGIPWYYTRFGYELPIGKYGGRSLVRSFVPGTLASSLAPFDVRPAVPLDAEFIQATYCHGMRRFGMAYARTEAHWLYELRERDARNRWSRQLFVLEQGDVAVGFLSMNPRDGSVDAFETRPGTPWSLAVFSVAKWLVNSAEPATIARLSWSFGWLGTVHPAFEAAPQLFGHPETLGTPFRRGAWYLRVPDLVAFVRTVRPALEQRLANSSESGYSGQLRIGRYGLPGLQLTIDAGSISVGPWQQRGLHDGEVRLADDSFLYLLAGSRSMEELELQFPYRVGVAPHIRPVMRGLFPARPAYVLPVY